MPISFAVMAVIVAISIFGVLLTTMCLCAFLGPREAEILMNGNRRFTELDEEFRREAIHAILLAD